MWPSTWICNLDLQKWPGYAELKMSQYAKHLQCMAKSYVITNMTATYKTYKKLSCRRGTARRAMLASSYYVSRDIHRVRKNATIGLFLPLTLQNTYRFSKIFWTTSKFVVKRHWPVEQRIGSSSGIVAFLRYTTLIGRERSRHLLGHAYWSVIGRQRRDWHVPIRTLRRHHVPGGDHLPWQRGT